MSSKAGGPSSGPLPLSTKLPCAEIARAQVVKTFDATACACSYAGYGIKKLGALRRPPMITDSGTVFTTGSIKWEGVLVGALDCAVDQNALTLCWLY